MKKPFTLVDNIAQWRHWWSLRFISLSAFFSAVIVAYNTFPADWLPAISPTLKHLLAIGAMLSAGLAGVSRIVAQKPKDTP